MAVGSVVGSDEVIDSIGEGKMVILDEFLQ